jgi:hypothetical protein
MTAIYPRSIARTLGRAASPLLLIAGVLTAAAGAPSGVQAARSHSPITTPCFSCNHQPTVNSPYEDDNTGTLPVSGYNFAPGDPLYVELIAGDGWNFGAMMAEAYTTASLQLTLPLGNGQSVHVPGGTFSVVLTPSPRSPILCQGVIAASVRVVDTLTGASASSHSLTLWNWWEMFARPLGSCA